MSQPSWIGQTIGGRYQILELIGQGGMSAVYKARDPNLQRIVAIKLIHSFLASDPSFILRFKEEARAIANLRHANIVQVYDYNVDGDVSYMVQEYIPGETLQAHLQHLNEQQRCMPMEEVFRISHDILSALGYAHRRGIIHRDIKPSNIMINVYGQAILMDFGIVKIMGGESHTASGAVVGTAMYIPPEFIRGEQADERSDLYSFGVTLFEMVSGRPPYEADSAMTLMMMHLNDPIPDISKLRSDIPAGFPSLIERALAKERVERFGSAYELAAALESLKKKVQDSPQDVTSRFDENTAPKNDNSVQSVIPNGTQASQPHNQRLRKASSNNAGVETAPLKPLPSIGGKSENPQAEATSDKVMRILPYLIFTVLGALMVVFILAGIFIGRTLNTGKGGQTQSAVLPQATSVKITNTPTLIPAGVSLQTSAPGINALPRVEPPVDRHFAVINEITLDEQSHYVVDYETFGFTPIFPGEHTHFFFNTVPRQQAGSPGTGPWYQYGGPWPFKDASAGNRPENAAALCVLVANPDHTPQPESGNCWPLPDVPVLTALEDKACLSFPAEGSPQVAPIAKLTMLLVRGQLAEGSWWLVQNPASLDDSCWVLADQVFLSGDVSAVADITPAPLPGN